MSNQKPFANFFEIKAFIVSLVVSVTSAIIYMQIIPLIGFTHNTSIIGTVIIMTMTRFTFSLMREFSPLNRRNPVRTITFGYDFSVDGGQYRLDEAGISVFR